MVTETRPELISNCPRNSELQLYHDPIHLGKEYLGLTFRRLSLCLQLIGLAAVGSLEVFTGLSAGQSLGTVSARDVKPCI